MRNLILAAMLLALLQILSTKPDRVHAQVDSNHLFIEPGTTILRDPATGFQIHGKVMIDCRSGEVWGFPTISTAPYPVVLSQKEAPISKPIYLGKFDLSVMRSR